MVLRTFLWGMTSTLPAAFLEYMFVWSDLVVTVLVAPIIEEYEKYFVVSRTVYCSTEFSEPMDGIVYSAAAALGFASVENLVCLLSARADNMLGRVFLGRAIFSVPGHVLFATIWGAALGRGKFVADQANRDVLIRGSLLTGMITHGFYNLLVVSEFIGAVGLANFPVFLVAVLSPSY